MCRICEKYRFLDLTLKILSCSGGDQAGRSCGSSSSISGLICSPLPLPCDFTVSDAAFSVTTSGSPDGYYFLDFILFLFFFKYVFICIFGCVLVAVQGIQFPDQGSNPDSPHWERGACHRATREVSSLQLLTHTSVLFKLQSLSSLVRPHRHNPHPPHLPCSPCVKKHRTRYQL